MHRAQSAFKPQLLRLPPREVEQVSINFIRSHFLQAHWADQMPAVWRSFYTAYLDFWNVRTANRSGHHEMGQLLDHRPCPGTQ